MKLTIEPTKQFVTVDGVRARVWRGVAEGGAEAELLVAGIAVPKREDAAAFSDIEPISAPVPLPHAYPDVMTTHHGLRALAPTLLLPLSFNGDADIIDAHGNVVATVNDEGPATDHRIEIAAAIVTSVNTCAGYRAELSDIPEHG